MKQFVSLKKSKNYQLLSLVGRRLSKEYPGLEFITHNDVDGTELYTYVSMRDIICFLREDVRTYVKELKPYFK